MIKSRRERWLELVAHMGERMVHTGFWWGNLRGSDHFKDLGIDERIILKWIFKELVWVDGDWIHLAEYRDKLICHKLS
jgi:hypothetical protein